MIPENDLEVATEGGTFVSVTGGTINAYNHMIRYYH